MPPFKVWDSSRQLKKIVIAATLSELLTKGLFVHKRCKLNLGYMWLVTINIFVNTLLVNFLAHDAVHSAVYLWQICLLSIHPSVRHTYGVWTVP